MLPALERSSILRAATERVTVELAGAATRSMLVLDRREGSDAELKSVTIIERMDEEMLMRRLERAFKAS